MNRRRTIDGASSKGAKATGFPWLRAGFFVLVCGVVVFVNGPLPEKIWRKWRGSGAPESPATKPVAVDPVVQDPVAVEPDPAPVEKVQPKPPVSDPLPLPPRDHSVSSGGDVRKMSRGFKLHTKVTVEKGGLASVERRREESYSAHYELKIKLPEPSRTLADLEQESPGLGTMLPGLEVMMSEAEVSRFFYQAYENKVNRLKLKSTRLSELMTRHNFYDCETILDLKHPETGQRVMLMQSEMDVVSDGSDGDRLPTMPDKVVNSSHYQPMTSYGWRKTGKTPNPLIKGWKGRIKKANAEIALKETSKERRDWLKMRIKKIKREIEDMEARSYLIAEYDPFIVMPINMVTYKGDKKAARVGDYAVVIYQGKIYPCLVGDAGPSFKTGEGSLRMAKQLNPKAGIYSRPVSDLQVTYLVFPGSADKFQAPDYIRWRQRCAELLDGVGGLGEAYSLHEWKNTLPVIPSNKQEQTAKSKGGAKEQKAQDGAENKDPKSSAQDKGGE